MIQKLQQIYDNAYTIYTDAVNSLIAVEKPSEHEVERESWTVYWIFAGIFVF